LLDGGSLVIYLQVLGDGTAGTVVEAGSLRNPEPVNSEYLTVHSCPLSLSFSLPYSTDPLFQYKGSLFLMGAAGGLITDRAEWTRQPRAAARRAWRLVQNTNRLAAAVRVVGSGGWTLPAIVSSFSSSWL